MYASIWCNYNHTYFVLVSFPMKEFGSLALMATLAEPPFGTPMTLNPSAI